MSLYQATASNVLNISVERNLKTAGDLFINQSDYENALDLVESTLALEPLNKRAWILRGDILYCLHRDREALACFNTALEQEDDCIEALLSKAGVLEALGALPEALKTCNRILGMLHLDDLDLLFVVSDQKISVLCWLRRYREATACLNELKQQLPRHQFRYLNATYRTVLNQAREHRNKGLRNRPALRVIEGAPATR
ncbi:MAG: tetratricopeptide repeat protein [Candidatus Melainabacteria bacterium]